MTLFLARGAVIRATQDTSSWPLIEPLPSYGRGRELPGGRYISLIHGNGLQDVVITGENGTIDGQGSVWWDMWKKGTLPFTRPHLQCGLLGFAVLEHPSSLLQKPLALNLLRLFTSQAGSDSGSFNKPFIAFVLGGPGSGKGTQCSRIASNFGFAHLSAGDLLRNEISSGSEKGELILDIIKEGRIVPLEITVELIRKAMESSNTKRVLIDGFPRCEENIIAFERMVFRAVDSIEIICVQMSLLF